MASPTPDAAPTPPPPTAAHPAFGLGDAVVLGLSSSGPAQTLAVSLASMVAACHYGGPLALLIAFFPMLGIALAYQRLNRWDPSAGATYTWVARVFHPHLGFLSGWMILIYYTLGTSSLTIPAGTYTLELLAPAAVNRPWAVALAGGTWNVVVTALALAGLRVASRFEWVVVVFQYLVLLALAACGIAALRAAGAGAAWFTWPAMGGPRGLLGGILVACFMYSGWDAAVYVNEETEDGARSAGLAAIASVVILALLYAVATFGLQAVLSEAELHDHAGNALAVISGRLLPGPYRVLVSLAVLTGTLATLQAAVIAAARVGLAMARDGVMPRVFTRRAAVSGTPWAATLTMSVLNLALLVLALATGTIADALGNVAASLGLLSCLFYALTGAAALWQHRARSFDSAADLWLGLVLPALGLAFMVFVVVASVATGATSPTVLAYGAGSIALGVLVALVLDLGLGRPFFRRPDALSALPGAAISGGHPTGTTSGRVPATSAIPPVESGP